MPWLASEHGGIEYSRRLPPPEAWKRPDRWLDQDTHKARRYGSRLYLYPDDRGFLMPDAVIRQVKDAFFWDDYDWPFDPNDPETRPDDHHMHYERRLYRPEMHGGDMTAYEFRETPAVIARIPRQIHNVIHDLTLMPQMPQRDAMREFVDSYQLARQIFKRLYISATLALATSRQFGIEQQIDEDLLRSTFSHHFADYSAAVDDFNGLPSSTRANLDTRLIDATLDKPNFVVHKLGSVATRGAVDLLPLLRHAA